LAQAPGNFVAVDPWQADVDERKLDSTRRARARATPVSPSYATCTS
jgi:hypothetical protein